MKTYEGGIVQGRKKKFAVVRVKLEILKDRELAIETIQSLLPVFDGLPVVLVAQKEDGEPEYFARPDLILFLRDFHLPSVEWKKYRVE